MNGSGCCLFRIVLILVLTLACPAMDAVAREVHSGRPDVIVAIDAGHSLTRSGAVSARGNGEYGYNANMAILLLQGLHAGGYVRSFIINRDGRELTLRERADIANMRNATILVSIHHDSVQPIHLKTWSYRGSVRRYSDRYSGYSVFYSGLNLQHRKALLLATKLGGALRQAGFSPSLHHAARISGEGRMLVDEARGVYRVDDFGIVKAPRMPAVILECGIIVNRDEESRLADSVYQQAMIAAIMAAIDSYTGEVGG